jgi:hypothetical protein
LARSLRKSAAAMIKPVAIVVLDAGSGCSQSRSIVSLPAPNPNGCYVRVHDHADFGGVGDVFNGPVRFWTLDQLPHTNEIFQSVQRVSVLECP